MSLSLAPQRWGCDHHAYCGWCNASGDRGATCAAIVPRDDTVMHAGDAAAKINANLTAYCVEYGMWPSTGPLGVLGGDALARLARRAAAAAAAGRAAGSR